MSAQRGKLLIVEDDPDQLAIRALLFERRGFECLQASNPEQALVLARGTGARCVLMDLNVPSASAGLEFIRELRALERPPSIVVLTGAVSPDTLDRPELRDVFAVVEKGGPSARLVETVERACPA